METRALHLRRAHRPWRLMRATNAHRTQLNAHTRILLTPTMPRLFLTRPTAAGSTSTAASAATTPTTSPPTPPTPATPRRAPTPPPRRHSLPPPPRWCGTSRRPLRARGTTTTRRRRRWGVRRRTLRPSAGGRNASACAACVASARDRVIGQCLPGSDEGYGLNAGCVIRYSARPFYLSGNAAPSGAGLSGEYMLVA